MRDILRDFSARGSTVFITSHVLDVVEKLCTHFGIVDKGLLVADGAVAELGGESLESVFLKHVGPADDAQKRLSWLQGDDAH